MKRALLFLAALATLSTLTACNTVRGVGEDVSALGRGISSASGR